MRTYSVYVGRKKDDGPIVYVGTTVQQPADRFRWHKSNGKPLRFQVVGQFADADQMLSEELRLIELHKPAMNKIRHRRQNLNAKLTDDVLQARKGADDWCQSCLRRHVKAGYRACFYCS